MMQSPHFKPVVLLPSYNSGKFLKPTVEGALKFAPHVWVVLDGTSDGSERSIESLVEAHANLQVSIIKSNSGKGAAVASALSELSRQNFTHVLTMDADGQHPPNYIPDFLNVARNFPQDIIMGNPVFGPDVPLARLKGRKLNIWWTDLETFAVGLGDSLFGMRVYPLQPLVKAFHQTRFAKRFDFDPEIAVRMIWQGCRPRQVSVPVRYFSKKEGGISHFHYFKDNVRLTFLHFRLIPELIFLRWPLMLKYKRMWKQ